ncbi:MAG: PQQ-binding-like beta-propeller repeat protein [Acidobacteria bacterium]|nr:PQQ-binding-like beta-propeller repeat protein [Acidobacteriota bacterium]
MCFNELKKLIFLLSLLICFSAFGQNTLWQYNSPAPLIFDPTVGPNGNVYFATDDAKVRALDSDGKPIWETKVGGVLTSPIALFEDRLFFATSAADLRAYGTDGNMVWTLKLIENATTPLAVTGQKKIFFGTKDGYLYCVDGNGGAVLWKKKLGFAVGPPSIGADGTIYVASENFLHAITETGNIKWRVNCFNYSEVPIVIDAYDHLFYIRGGILDVYNKFGDLIWEAYDDKGNLIEVETQPPILYGDSAIFVLSGKGDLISFDVFTGATNWKFSETCDAYKNTWSPEIVGIPAIDSLGYGMFCDASGELVYFEATCGHEYGWHPTVEGYSGTNAILTARKNKGLVVVATGQGKRSIQAITHWAPPAGNYSQWLGNPAHLQRRDDPPLLQLARPYPNENITSLLQVEASATDDFGIKSMELYINDNFILKSTRDFIGWNTDASSFADGAYTVSVVAFDYTGNSTVENVDVTVQTPVPVYGLYSSPPLFSWIPYNDDTKFQVNIGPDPSFYYIIVKSGDNNHPYQKMLSWQPSEKKWKKILKFASEQPTNQVTFYWRVVGKYYGETVRKSFIIDKTK